MRRTIRNKFYKHKYKKLELELPQYHKLSGVEAILNNVTRFGIFLVFFIYSIGFIVWQSFLSQYGVSIDSFFQIQIVSAAGCYLLMLIIFLLPLFLLFNFLPNKTKNESRINFRFIVAFWVVIVFSIGNVAFPEKSNPFFNVYIIVLIATLVLHFIAYIILTIIKHKFSLYKLLDSSLWFPIYLLLFMVVPITFKPTVDFVFLFYTVLLYFYGFAYGLNVYDIFDEKSNVVIILKFLVILSLLVSHCYIFGTRQFSKLPKSIGGGRPELAYFLPSERMKSEAIAFFDLPHNGNVIGPVAIISKSEKEIIFIKNEELNNNINVSAKSIRFDILDGIKYLPSSEHEKVFKF